MRKGIPGVVAVILAAIFLAGCRQPQQAAPTPNERQARLLAAENADLQKQLAIQQAETKTLRQKHAQELQHRDEELAACKARINTLQKEIDKGIAERAGNLATTLMQENAKLRQEVEQLKAEAQKQPEP